MTFVLDVSAALPWFLLDEATPVSAELFERLTRGEVAIVPAHWPAEMLSSLLRGKRRGRISASFLSETLDDLNSLPIVVDSSLRLADLTTIRSLSEDLALSPYDAIYLALALREHLPLATNDAALVRACLSSGVALTLLKCNSATANVCVTQREIRRIFAFLGCPPVCFMDGRGTGS